MQRADTSIERVDHISGNPPAAGSSGLNAASGGKSNWYDMREFMTFLEREGDLVRIHDEVDPDWEVNGITRIGLQEFGPAILFEKIKGTDIPMVANLLGTDGRFLSALGIDKWSEFNEEWIRRTGNPVAPRITADAPCQDVVISGDDIDLNRICSVKWHQFDGGPFPGTLSVSVTKDPDTGVLNAGIYRMATLGKTSLGWGAPEYTHGRQHYMKYESRGEPMPMAVSLTSIRGTMLKFADTVSPVARVTSASGSTATRALTAAPPTEMSRRLARCFRPFTCSVTCLCRTKRSWRRLSRPPETVSSVMALAPAARKRLADKAFRRNTRRVPGEADLNSPPAPRHH